MPAEVGWPNAAPKLDSVDVQRKVVLGFHRACAVCGYPMPGGSRVYRAFAQADAAEIRLRQRERSLDPSGPLHMSCIIYSSMACPYLREKTSRLGPDSRINPGARRGTLAAVMGFEDFGLLVCMRPWTPEPPGEIHAPQFAYLTLVDDIRYRTGTELADRYESAIETDRALIDMTESRWYWAGTAADKADLEKEAQIAMRTIKKREPLYETAIPGQGYYVALPL